MNLALLLGHVPGFADAANLDQKIHEIAARFLGQAGIDYEADVRPWIGNQLSVALRAGADDLATPTPILLAAVKDQAAAESGMEAIAAGRGLTGVEGHVSGHGHHRGRRPGLGGARGSADRDHRPTFAGSGPGCGSRRTSFARR